MNLQANQNVRRLNSGPGIFSLDLRPKFWEWTAFETLQFYWWKENFARWTPQNPIGSSSTSSCSFCLYLLWFWHDVSSTSRWKLFDLVPYHQVPGVGQSTQWPNGSLTPNECQFPAAWKTTQISTVQRLCTLALQRTLQGLRQWPEVRFVTRVKLPTAMWEAHAIRVRFHK